MMKVYDISFVLSKSIIKTCRIIADFELLFVIMYKVYLPK
jgi:hypothetical protein